MQSFESNMLRRPNLPVLSLMKLAQMQYAQGRAPDAIKSYKTALACGDERYIVDLAAQLAWVYHEAHGDNNLAIEYFTWAIDHL